MEGVASALASSLHDGVDATEAGTPTSLEARREAFGANRFKAIPAKSFFTLWFANLKDPIIIMLMVAALVRAAGGGGGGVCAWAGAWEGAGAGQG